MHWLYIHLGLADGNSSWYLFPSGWGGILLVSGSFLAAPYTTWRRHNCQVRGCWRIGRHEFTDPDEKVTRQLCWHHHPDVQHKHLTRERLHLYAGKRPGPG